MISLDKKTVIAFALSAARPVGLALCFMLSPALAIAAATDAAPGMQLKTEAFREVEVTDKSGKKEKKRQPLTRALPGQEVIYDISYRNAGSKPAEKVVVNNAVPKGLLYQPGSAQGTGTRIEFSVDGGKTYGSLEALRVTGADGKPRAAKADEVTHLRWTLMTALKPSAEGKVSYRAMLK